MNYLKPLLLCFVIFFLTLCASNEPHNGNDINIVIYPNNLTLSTDASEKNIYYTVKSDKSLLVSSNGEEWCNAAISNVSKDNLRISISENHSFKSRKSTVTVDDGVEQIIITIEQSGSLPEISVDKQDFIIQFGIREFSLEVVSNMEVTFELPDWITLKSEFVWKKGKNKFGFCLSSFPEGLFYREGEIVIRPIDNEIDIAPQRIHITQTDIAKIIAHRGFWQIPDYPQNSRASLQRAVDLGIYGSELDVYITRDGALLLNHDATINGINIENSTFEELKDVRLSNGETIPLLKDAVEIVNKQGRTKLIIEIKPHADAANENRAVDAVLQLVEDSRVEKLVDYISFSRNVCNRIIEKSPESRVAYLAGNLSPEKLKSDGYWGLDYSSEVLKNNSTWIGNAQKIGLTTNVWTINTTADFEYFIEMGVNFITTDYPQTLKDILSSK